MRRFDTPPSSLAFPSAAELRFFILHSSDDIVQKEEYKRVDKPFKERVLGSMHNYIIKRLSLLPQVLVCQEIQESDSQHTEFVLLAMNVITNNDKVFRVLFLILVSHFTPQR